MTTPDFLIALFYAVDQEMLDVPKHPDAKLYPSAVVTLALLYAIKGGGTRAFSRWLTRDSVALVPQVPERTRLARLCKTHTAWTARFMAAPTVLGVADSYGIALIHPMWEGRSPAQIGKQGYSNHRWIVGGKLCFILNQWGLLCAWECAPANVHDTHFQPLIAQFDGQMIVLTDTGFHAKTGDPGNLTVCPRGTWNTRMLVETVLSMLTTSHSAPFLRQYMEFCCSNMLLYLHMRIAYALPHPFRRSQEEKEDDRHESRNSITV